MCQLPGKDSVKEPISLESRVAGLHWEGSVRNWGLLPTLDRVIYIYVAVHKEGREAFQASKTTEL